VVAYGGDVTLSVQAGHPGLLWVEGSFDVGRSWTYRFTEPARVAASPVPHQVSFSTATVHDRHSGCTHLRVCWLPDTLAPSVQVKHLRGHGQVYLDHPHLVPDGKNGPLRKAARWVRARLT